MLAKLQAKFATLKICHLWVAWSSPYPTEDSYETRVFVQQPAAQLPDLGTPRQKPEYISSSGARGPVYRENQAGDRPKDGHSG
jgi:hypothetical protein